MRAWAWLMLAKYPILTRLVEQHGGTEVVLVVGPTLVLEVALVLEVVLVMDVLVLEAELVLEREELELVVEVEALDPPVPRYA